MPMIFAGENVVINTDALHYAALEADSEGLHVRLGFAPAGSELRLSGLEARAMLRWLRLNVGPTGSADSIDRDLPVRPASPRTCGPPACAV